MIKKYLELIKNIITTLFCHYTMPINLGYNVKFKGIPYILINRTATVSIGNNTIINSSNYGYHLNMHSKCKLYADRPNAIINIGNNCRIHGTCIHAYKRITIGNNCLIAANTQIIDGNGHLLSFDYPHNRLNTKDFGKQIIIEDNVWIAANCIIKQGITIGDGAVIGANSFVNRNVEPFTIVYGTPAKFHKYRFNKEVQYKIIASAFWNYPPSKAKKILTHLDIVL